MKNFLSSLMHYCMNYIISFFPIMCVRKLFYKLVGIKIEKHSYINMRLYVLAPNNISIGSGTHINQSVFLDGRGGIEIGKNVSISHYVKIVTGSHDVQSAKFEGKFDKVKIDDNCFLGCDCKILQGCTIGKGAVVCSGAVVTKNVEDYSIVAGIPARKIGERNKELMYKCRPQEFFR